MKKDQLFFAIRLSLVIIILAILQPDLSDFRITKNLQNASYFMQNNLPERAETDLRVVIGMEPWQEIPWSQLAASYLNQDNSLKTISILEPLSRQSILNASDWLTLARAYKQYDRPGQMESALLSLISLGEPGVETVTAIKMLVILYRSQNRFEEAYQFQSELVRLVPGNKDYLYEKILLGFGVEPQIGMEERQSILGEPVWLGHIIDQINTVVKEPNESVKMLKIGRVFGGAGVWDLAEYWFQKSVQTSPDYAEAWAFLAEARQQRGLDGKEQISRALRLEPDSTGVRALAAAYYRRQHIPDQAIALLRQNIAAEPSESTWYLELGSVLAESGKMEMALETYQNVIELYPENSEMYIALANFSAQYQYRVEDVGKPAAEKAISLAEDSPAAQDIYGVILTALGETKKADNAFSLALSAEPDYVPTWLHIGQSAIAEGDFDLAREALLKATAGEGNSIERQKAIRLLEQYFHIRMDK